MPSTTKFTLPCNKSKDPKFIYNTKSTAILICNSCKHKQTGRCTQEITEIQQDISI